MMGKHSVEGIPPPRHISLGLYWRAAGALNLTLTTRKYVATPSVHSPPGLAVNHTNYVRKSEGWNLVLTLINKFEFEFELQLSIKYRTHQHRCSHPAIISEIILLS